MINRAEAKIAVRDLVLANLLNYAIGEGVGNTYLEAIQEADRQADAAMRAATTAPGRHAAEAVGVPVVDDSDDVAEVLVEAQVGD